MNTFPPSAHGAFGAQCNKVHITVTEQHITVTEQHRKPLIPVRAPDRSAFHR